MAGRANGARVAAFTAALAAAPREPGVYFFLGPQRELLYIGKAADIQLRLRQHARAAPRPGTRMCDLYGRIRAVRWQTTVDEAAATNREADLIVALLPPFNASLTGDGRWAFVQVWPGIGGALQFVLAPGADCEGGRAYGCFPHLGVGVTSAPAIACSEGYSAFLRVLWAASDAPGHHFPRPIAGASPPARGTIRVAEPLRPALHAFLSGTSRRLLPQLAVQSAHREPFMQPALARDQRAAAAFFAHGPKALRALRLRHRIAAGPMARSTIADLFACEVRNEIGDFTVLRLDDPTHGLLGPRAAKTVSVGAARRAQQRSRR